MTNFSVIIPAAGGGSRSGSNIPKQYVELLGRPVLAHTLRAFHSAPGLIRIVVAVDPQWRKSAERCAAGLDRIVFVDGGAERQHSIANALTLIGDEAEVALVHDAARPCISGTLIERVVTAAREFGAVVPVRPIPETVKRVTSQGVIVATVPRDDLRVAQTPQGFRLDLLRAAHAHAVDHGIVGTDDASLVEAYGATTRVVDGEPGNIKITYPEDFSRAEEILKRMWG